MYLLINLLHRRWIPISLSIIASYDSGRATLLVKAGFKTPQVLISRDVIAADIQDKDIHFIVMSIYCFPNELLDAPFQVPSDLIHSTEDKQVIFMRNCNSKFRL